MIVIGPFHQERKVMMVTQGKGNDNDNAGGLSTNTKHSRFHDDIHDDNDIEDNIDVLCTNALLFISFNTSKIMAMHMLKTYRVSIH